MPMRKTVAVMTEMLKKVVHLATSSGSHKLRGFCYASVHTRGCGFWLRDVPPEMMQKVAEEQDMQTREAFRDLLPGDGLAWHAFELDVLPYGVGLHQTVRTVAEAMGEIEGARGAEKYIPACAKVAHQPQPLHQEKQQVEVTTREEVLQCCVSKIYEYDKFAVDKVAKVVRMAAGVPESIVNSSIKVVHLVRDPRGVIWSRLHQKKICDPSNITGCARGVCSTMAIKLQEDEAMSHLDNYYLRLRLEDLVAQPEMQLRRTFRFLLRPEAELHESFLKLLRQRTALSAQPSMGAPLVEPEQNSSVNEWKIQMPQAQQHVVLDTAPCSSVIRSLGYPLRAENGTALDTENLVGH
ncbi:hypothetical protein CYMTET_11678 [Cymbomonas tetramitiformis]|uniref:Sulfotransferase n=1 Tax=Cymbomonas tetramitiformis TaxID=36881 RepID=A0AAE0GM22_9CHLO|nr:hypothetical protein CYMTET_11678 [Cymbomonas tetramitiformis]